MDDEREVEERPQLFNPVLLAGELAGEELGGVQEIQTGEEVVNGSGAQEEAAQSDQLQDTKAKSRLKITIRKWSGVAVWKWLANDDTCGICRFPFHGCCPDCKYAGDDCPLVWGQCTHCFHIHCIMKWLGTAQTQHQCPMCRQEWKFKE